MKTQDIRNIALALKDIREGAKELNEKVKEHKGVAYFKTRKDAEAHMKKFAPKGRVVEYERGHAVQTRISGPYLNKAGIAEGVKKEMTDMEKTRAMASNPPKKDKQDTKNRPPSELMNQKEGAKQGKSIKGYIQPGKRVGMKDDASNDMSDDGEGLDKADPKAAKKKFKDRKDKDIDNDGDVDSSDKFLHKRRKAVSKAIASKKKPSAEKDADVEVQEVAEDITHQTVKPPSHI